MLFYVIGTQTYRNTHFFSVFFRFFKNVSFGVLVNVMGIYNDFHF